MKILRALAKPFTALAGNVNSTIEQKILGGVIRHCAGFLAGGLAMHGVIVAGSQSRVEDAIAVLLGVLVASSSIKQKIDAHV